MKNIVVFIVPRYLILDNYFTVCTSHFSFIYIIKRKKIFDNSISRKTLNLNNYKYINKSCIYICIFVVRYCINVFLCSKGDKKGTTFEEKEKKEKRKKISQDCYSQDC